VLLLHDGGLGLRVRNLALPKRFHQSGHFANDELRSVHVDVVIAAWQCWLDVEPGREVVAEAGVEK
jgi:hypothetical protein